jgi:REP element-mobilizing transposase RayT
VGKKDQLELPGVKSRPSKRTALRKRIPHRARPVHDKRHPVHVTVHARGAVGVPSFRSQRVFKLVLWILAKQREYAEKFQITHFSIQSNHIHLIIEAEDGPTLAKETRHLNGIRSGVSGFLISFAKRLNRALGRTGSVWLDRYHRRDLATPTEVRNALRYVLCNYRHHGLAVDASRIFDVYSSAQHFDGFSGALGEPYPEPAPWTEIVLTTWLLRAGWKKAGLIDPLAQPGEPA